MRIQTILISPSVSDVMVVEARHEFVGPSIMESIREGMKKFKVDNPEGLLQEIQKRVEAELHLTHYGTLLKMNRRLRDMDYQMHMFREEFDARNLEVRVMDIMNDLDTRAYRTINHFQNSIQRTIDKLTKMIDDAGNDAGDEMDEDDQ